LRTLDRARYALGRRRSWHRDHSERYGAAAFQYDVSADGWRFLMIKGRAADEPNATPVSMIVVLNWLEERDKQGDGFLDRRLGCSRNQSPFCT
jgi:hypothetical protein